MSTELTLVENGMNLLEEVEKPTSFMCSMKAETREDKMKIFNITNNPTKRLAECVNIPIRAKDLYMEIVECEKPDEPGEKTTCPRIVLIDENGESYQCVSFGVFNALKKIIGLIGAPTWEEPITVIPYTIQKGERSILTLKLG